VARPHAVHLQHRARPVTVVAQELHTPQSRSTRSTDPTRVLQHQPRSASSTGWKGLHVNHLDLASEIFFLHERRHHLDGVAEDQAGLGPAGFCLPTQLRSVSWHTPSSRATSLIERPEERTSSTASRLNSSVYFDGRSNGDTPSSGLKIQCQGVHTAGGSPDGGLPRRRRGLLLRMTHHDRGVHIQHQDRDRLTSRPGHRQPTTGLHRLGPGHVDTASVNPAQPIRSLVSTAACGRSVCAGRVVGGRWDA